MVLSATQLRWLADRGFEIEARWDGSTAFRKGRWEVVASIEGAASLWDTQPHIDDERYLSSEDGNPWKAQALVRRFQTVKEALIFVVNSK